MKFNFVKTKLAFLLCAALSSALPVQAASDSNQPPGFKRKLGVGLAYTGGLLRYGFKKHWSLEGHYLIGKASSNDGDVSSSAVGLRVYRHFRLEEKLQCYAGADASYLSATSNNFKSSAGFGGGGFGGLEYYILPRLSVGLDLGPYFITMNKNNGVDSESGVDFVLNTFLNFYIF